MLITKFRKIDIYKSDAFFVALQKITQGFIGFLIVLLISSLVDLDYQGYYFALVNVAATYSILDLGLSVLLVQISASLFGPGNEDTGRIVKHHRHHLFVDMVLWAKSHFTKLSFLFLIFLPIGFLYFLKSAPNIPTNIWLWPLIFTFFSVAFSIPAYAILSIIEGMGRIREVYVLRIIISITGGFLACFLIFTGKVLYAPSMMSVSLSLVTYYWVFKKYNSLFFSKKNYSLRPDKKWDLDLALLRNKVRLTSIATFLFQSGPTLIVFYFLGAHQAGQVGLSMSFIAMLNFLSSIFFTAKIPELTKVASMKKLNFFKLLFFRQFKRAVALTLISYSIWILFILIVSQYNEAISERFLRPLDMYLLLFNFMIIQLVTLLNTASRSYGLEIMALPFFFSTIISIFLSVLLNDFLGVTGMLAVMSFFYLIICAPAAFKYLNLLKRMILIHDYK
jgi:hypothetical protein